MPKLRFIALLLPAVAFADTGEELMQSLIREKWEPLPVRVEWTFRSSSIQNFENGVGWALGNPLPKYLAGSLTLNLIGASFVGQALSIPVSGNAKIFGASLTPDKYISVGDSVLPTNLIETELEWTNITETPVLPGCLSGEFVAARGLVPGRPLCESDLKSAPVIRKNQQVMLLYADGNILIGLAAEAMSDGAVGEIIPLRVDLDNNKHCRGMVVDKETVRFIQ